MSLAIADSLSLSYGPKVLLDEECFAIGPADRVGLVGPNGTGKSTLLKILSGKLAPDDGDIRFMRGARIGYLPQELLGLPEGPLVDAVLAQVPGRTRLEEELEGTHEALAAAEDEASQMELAQRLADLHATLDDFDGRFGRHRAETILAGLGFKASDATRPTSELSGGWRMRAALAGLLLTDPDLLLLDEPTNHLDVPTLAWFDDFLRTSRRALMLVCHDRDFLNRQISRVLSFEPEGLRSYAGNYEDYKRQRAVESEGLKSRAARQAARRAEVQSFIDRFRAKATKARQVKSKEKMLEREERIDVYEERKVLSFSFPEVIRAGREVARGTGISKRYGDNVVYDNLEFQVLRGQRIAVVGANGAGKSTLLKIIAGELAPDAGEIALGPNVTIGYYAQHHTEALKASNTVLSKIAALVPDKPQSWVRSVLGSFLFSGDDVDKPISALSGGERARVALARLLVIPSNLLLMDEPTNHLDLDSSEALIRALSSYSGTLVFVSHNRSFVNQLATHVWDVEDHKLHVYPGNLDEYLHHRKMLAESASATSKAQESEASDAVSTKERRRIEAEARQAKSAREKPVRTEIARIEARVAVLETQAKEAEKALADPDLYADYDRSKPHMETYRVARAELDVLYERWDEQQRLLESLPG